VTTYTAKLRNDVKFSDGEPRTADDVIFSYYCIWTPPTKGSTRSISMDIIA
jgi:peptide/nickel transport system substrate-binding protein